MNKKLLAIAVGAALVAGPTLTANAGEVTVYGQVQVELAQEDVDVALGAGVSEEFLRTNSWDGGAVSGNTAGDPPGDVLTMEDNQRGRFGIKASEDLGGGLKGLAVIEYDMGSNETGGSGPTIRHASVGLGGGFGTVLVGALKMPYKYTGGIKYDPFVATNLEARRSGGMTGGNFGHNGFISNAISFETKAIPMTSIWVLYSPDEQGVDSGGNSGTGSQVGDAGDYSAALKVGDKAWEVFVATAHNEDNSGVFNQHFTAVKVGGKVKVGKMHTIVAQYETTEEDVSTGVSLDGKILFLGYHLTLGNTTLVGQVGQGELERTATTNVQEHLYYTVGAIHKFSKTTRLFGGYTTTTVDQQNFVTAADGDRKAISIGLRKDF